MPSGKCKRTTPCLIDTAWCTIGAGDAHAPPGPSSPAPLNRMHSGVPTTKGNFSSVIAGTVTQLTITDFASRYLLTCEALLTTQEKFAFTVFERTFTAFGLPQVIRTDNGVPFASAHALYGLSKRAVWWLRLGIQIERITPGHPQPNGRHERMHLTLKREATKPAAANVLQQQARFDDFITRYNTDRPHQALGMNVPGDVYAAHGACIEASRNSLIPSTIRPSW